MFSAIPIIAVKQRIRKPKIRRPRFDLAAFKRKRAAKRGSHDTVSTIPNTLHEIRGSSITIEVKKNKKYFNYATIFFLIAGLLLVFIGICASVPHTQTAGFCFIGLSGILYIIRMFYLEKQSQIIQESPTVLSESIISSPTVASTVSTEITPITEVDEFSSLPASPISEQGFTNVALNNAERTNSISITSNDNNTTEAEAAAENE